MAVCPVEQGSVGRHDAVPHLFDCLDIKGERLGKRCLGEACGYADAQGPGRHFEKCEALVGRQRVEQSSQGSGRFGATKRHQPVHNSVERQILRFRLAFGP